MTSIRESLSASKAHDAIQDELEHSGHVSHTRDVAWHDANGPKSSLVDLFRANLEAVDGHCIVVDNEDAVVRAMQEVIVGLREAGLAANRIAISDASVVQRSASRMGLQFADSSVVEKPADFFRYDVGITAAQGAIAETGTLILDSVRERHRLASLLPPVHIAIIDADQICLTLGEALEALQHEDEISPTITFITGPSRTADIELTLAIGVHGPQKLYVIVNNESKPL